MLKKQYLLLLSGALLTRVFGVELYNSSFELDGSGFALNRYSREFKTRPLQFDRSAPWDGAQCLKAENPDADMLVLNSSEFLLEKGKTYTISWSMKSSADIPAFRAGIYSTLSAEQKGLWVMHNRILSIRAGDWKRYSITVTAGNDRPYHLDFRWGNVNGKPAPGTVWMDAIQIDEGERALPWRPSKRCSGAVMLPKRVFPEKRVHGSLLLLNPGRNAEEVTFVLKLSETVFPEKDAQIFRKKISLPCGRTSVKFSFPVERYGHFRIEGSLESREGKSRIPDVYLARTYPVDPSVPDLSRELQMGIDFSHGAINPNQSGMKLAYRGQEASLEEYYAFFASSGVKILRTGNVGSSFSWALMEPEAGRFEWRFVDLWIQQSRRHGMAVMPVLGNMFYLRDAGNQKRSKTKIPAHVMAKSKIVPNPVRCGAWDGIEPDMESWNRYVDQVTKRYRGRISAYEITNEPNICITGRAYSRYLIAAAERIRKNDPRALIVGGGVTTDYNGESDQFLREICESGAIQLCDALSFHPYSSPQENSRFSSIQALANLREKAARARKTLVPWCTELYYLRSDSGADVNLQQKRMQPSDLLRRFLVDAGEGVQQCIYLIESSLIQNELMPSWEGISVVATVQLIPNAVYMAHNAGAHLFAGAVPLGKYDWGKGIACYRYRDRNGEEIAAFWNYGTERKHLKLNGKNLRLMDLFGNPVAWQDPLPLSEKPWYLRGDDLDGVLKRAVLQK